jgi:c-di-GMP-binding flagellar brake protein YcgR
MPQQTPDSEQILAEAVARNLGVTISLPSAGMDKHFKTRFLGEMEDGLWIEAVAGSSDLLKMIVAEGRPMDVCFHTPTRVLSFATTGVRYDDAVVLNSETTVPGMLVAKPKDIKNVQRRNAYRVPVYSDSGLTVRAWYIPEHVRLDDRPNPAHELKIELVDLSVGGVGMRLPAPTEGKQQVKLVPDQRLRVEMTLGEQKLLFDGRFRPAPPTTNGKQLTAGIVFKNLEADLEGRQKLNNLNRIVSQLQREQAKRARLQ